MLFGLGVDGGGQAGAEWGDLVIGIGLDVVELGRFRRTLARTPTFGRRVFTSAEVEYSERRRDPTERYAVRFAAKEAVLKAMGVGLWSCPLNEIEVVRADSGEPSVLLHDDAAGLAAERGIEAWHLTLTHTDLVAQAIAVAFGSSDRGEASSVLARIRLPVWAHELSRTVAFYEDVLGFVTEREADGQVDLALGDVRLDVRTRGGERSGGNPAPGFVLEVSDVRAAFRRARRHAPDVLEAAPDAHGRPVFRVVDPDGTVVTVVTHG